MERNKVKAWREIQAERSKNTPEQREAARAAALRAAKVIHENAAEAAERFPSGTTFDAEAFARAERIKRGLNALAEAVLADSPPELDPDGLDRA